MTEQTNQPALKNTIIVPPASLTVAMLETAQTYAAANPQDEDAQIAVDLLSEDTRCIEENKRPNAPASQAQLAAIDKLIARHCPGHTREWFHHFTKSVLDVYRAKNRLTAREAAQIENALINIAKKRCRAGDFGASNAALDIVLKFDVYPDDWERAKAEYNAAVLEQVRIVTKGRTTRPTYMTRGEAVVYSRSIERLALSFQSADKSVVAG